MATCGDVIAHAFHICNWRGLSESPTDAENAFALSALQGMLDRWVAGGMFGRLNDKLVAADYTALEGDRVVKSGTPAVTIPDTYACDGSEGTDRPPYDLSLIEVQGVSGRNVWLYDRTAWVDIAALALDDDCPLASRGLNGLAGCLAMEIAGSQGDVPDMAQRAASQFMAGLSYKTGSERAPRQALYY